MKSRDVAACQRQVSKRKMDKECRQRQKKDNVGKEQKRDSDKDRE
jgi:hypothetical protein